MKTQLRIMDSQLEFLQEIDDYESFIFTKNHRKYGSFTLVINKNKNGAKSVTVGNLVYVSETMVGYIEEVNSYLSPEAANPEIIEAKGCSLEHLLTYRITEPMEGSGTWLKTGSAETVIKELVSYNMGKDARAERVIPLLEIGKDIERGDELTWESTYKNLDEEVEAICNKSGLGIEITFDFINKKFVFDVVKGKNRGIEQEGELIAPVILSTEYDNIFEASFVMSNLDYKTTAIVAGGGEGANRDVVVVQNQPMGVNRREVFVENRAVDLGNFQKLVEAGTQKLEEKKQVLSLDGKVTPYFNRDCATAQYGRDFYLGDIVTMKYDTIVMDKEITEVTESWDQNQYSMECIFGHKPPDLLDKIKEMNK